MRENNRTQRQADMMKNDGPKTNYQRDKMRWRMEKKYQYFII